MIKYVFITLSITLLIYIFISNFILKSDWIAGLVIYSVFLFSLVITNIFFLLKRVWNYAIINFICLVVSYLIYFSSIPETIPELFKSDKVLSAFNNEGLGGVKVILREDNSYEYITIDFLGNQEILKGEYSITHDTLYLRTSEEILTYNKFHISEDNLVFKDEWNYEHYFYITKEK